MQFVSLNSRLTNYVSSSVIFKIHTRVLAVMAFALFSYSLYCSSFFTLVCTRGGGSGAALTAHIE